MMGDELMPCPFCGEEPQVLRDGHTVAHACMVLDREIRTTRAGWNHRFERTCHAVHSETAMEDELVCSECGSSLGVVLRDGRTLLPRHCACCGSRIMRGDTDERS